jgi:hypothetical protein
LFVLVGSDEIGPENFECDVTMERLLKREVDFGHTPDAEPMENRVARDILVGQVVRVARSAHALVPSS